MVRRKPLSPSANTTATQSTREEFKNLRLAEMDTAYRLQLQALANLVRSARLRIRKPPPRP
jgi:hypothetical protein